LTLSITINNATLSIMTLDACAGCHYPVTIMADMLTVVILSVVASFKRLEMAGTLLSDLKV